MRVDCRADIIDNGRPRRRTLVGILPSGLPSGETGELLGASWLICCSSLHLIASSPLTLRCIAVDEAETVHFLPAGSSTSVMDV